MTIKLFCSKCGWGEPDRSSFTIINGNLICDECHTASHFDKK